MITATPPAMFQCETQAEYDRLLADLSAQSGLTITEDAPNLTITAELHKTFDLPPE